MVAAGRAAALAAEGTETAGSLPAFPVDVAPVVNGTVVDRADDPTITPFLPSDGVGEVVRDDEPREDVVASGASDLAPSSATNAYAAHVYVAVVNNPDAVAAITTAPATGSAGGSVGSTHGLLGTHAAGDAPTESISSVTPVAQANVQALATTTNPLVAPAAATTPVVIAPAIDDVPTTSAVDHAVPHDVAPNPAGVAAVLRVDAAPQDAGEPVLPVVNAAAHGPAVAAVAGGAPAAPELAAPAGPQTPAIAPAHAPVAVPAPGPVQNNAAFAANLRTVLHSGDIPPQIHAYVDRSCYP